MNNNSVAIKWEEPPAAAKRGRRGNEPWDAIGQALRDNPNRWALIARDKPASYGQTLKRRGGFEIRNVSAGLGYKKGYCDIYARFVGDSGE